MTLEKCSVCTTPFLITEMERGFFPSFTLEKEGEDIENIISTEIASSSERRQLRYSLPGRERERASENVNLMKLSRTCHVTPIQREEIIFLDYQICLHCNILIRNPPS